jgi:hypothetical protein
MLSINLFTFAMLRDARPGDTEPVIVILHGSHVLQQPTSAAHEVLLNETLGCTAMCTPLHFGPGTNYAAVTFKLHPIHLAFLRMSLMLMGPDVDRNLYQLFDIEGNCNGKQEALSDKMKKNVCYGDSQQYYDI